MPSKRTRFLLACAAGLSIAPVYGLASADTVPQPAHITGFRLKTVTIYDKDANGFHKMADAAVSSLDPVAIAVLGAEPNGMLKVQTAGKIFWLDRAETKLEGGVAPVVRCDPTISKSNTQKDYRSQGLSEGCK